ncbi:MAG TPA: hypothetical protein VEU29_04250 [Actinomycetota bacterium]|nr:hypothetical protein [Actinomycetota bacterium]
MRRTRKSWSVAVLTALVAGLAAAPSSGAPATGFASSNVEHVTTVPLEAGSPTGARLVGDYLYVAGAKSFSIYDVSDPLAPALQSINPIGFQFANEDVDTNGKVLIMSDDTRFRRLYVWDVTDKKTPVKLAELENTRDHNFACVLDCKWAYGSRGTIVDLREPTEPRIAGSWGGGVTPGDGFDTTEVAPGIVLASTRILRLLDARKNPARPKLVASATTMDNRLLHSSRWPRGGKDKFVLVQEETFAETRCDENSGTFMTWNASRWRKTGTFQMTGQYRASAGTYSDGSPVANVLGCTAMWFQEHPDFRDGGLVTAAWFEHGTRFLDVAPDGAISEVGHFLPLGGSTIASYWITDEIVYAIDVTRGIDILRFNAS